MRNSANYAEHWRDIEAATRAGDYKAILRKAKKLEKLTPLQPRLTLLIGLSLARLSRHSEALPYLKRWAKERPGDALAQLNVAHSYRELGFVFEAEEFYLKTLALDETNVEAAVNLGTLYAKNRRHEAAREMFRRALRTDGNHYFVLRNLALLEITQNRIDDAIEVCRAALAISRTPFMLVKLSDLLVDKGQADLAIPLLEECLRIEPDSVSAHLLLGKVLGEADDPVEAEWHYAELRRLFIARGRSAVNQSAFWAIWAGFLVRQGRKSEAESELRYALELPGAGPELIDVLGKILIAGARTAEAGVVLEQAIERYGRVPNLLVMRGFIHQRRGELEAAARLYREVVDQLEPMNAAANSNLWLLLDGASAWEPGKPDPTADARRLYGLRMRHAAEVDRFECWPQAGSGDRLRVGLVSGDLREHVVGRFLDSVLVALANTYGDEIDVYAYPTNKPADALSQRLRSHCRGWRSIEGKTALDAAAIIRADGIQILVDLSGHTGAGARTYLRCARRRFRFPGWDISQVRDCLKSTSSSRIPTLCRRAGRSISVKSHGLCQKPACAIRRRAQIYPSVPFLPNAMAM